jgi:L-lactate dehydrogenase complex protein LldF
VHLAFVPIEKLVPTIPDAVLMTQMLIQSATGQKLTSYVHWITGPRSTNEVDGPGELHIILVDNGRSAILGGPLEEALLCIRCGACLNACPVYRRVGGHAYGSVYPGPIGILVTPTVRGVDARTDELAQASSLCGACEQVCPVHIDIPRMILELRRQRVAARRLPFWERLAFSCFAALMRRPRLYRFALWFGALVAMLLSRAGRIHHAPGLGRWTSTRTLRAPARVPLHRRVRRGR